MKKAPEAASAYAMVPRLKLFPISCLLRAFIRVLITLLCLFFLSFSLLGLLLLSRFLVCLSDISKPPEPFHWIYGDRRTNDIQKESRIVYRV